MSWVEHSYKHLGSRLTHASSRKRILQMCYWQNLPRWPLKYPLPASSDFDIVAGRVYSNDWQCKMVYSCFHVIWYAGVYVLVWDGKVSKTVLLNLARMPIQMPPKSNCSFNCHFLSANKLQCWRWSVLLNWWTALCPWAYQAESEYVVPFLHTRHTHQSSMQLSLTSFDVSCCGCLQAMWKLLWAL